MERTPNEYELAVRAREGDPEALAELVERTRLRLFALAYAELRHYDDAQDAVAAALLQICLHAHELRQPERVVAWMQQIVRNEVHRLRRRTPGLAGSELALEYLMHMRATPETKETRVCVLYDVNLPQVAWGAYFLAGANRLASKQIEGDLSSLAQSLQGPRRQVLSWLRRSSRAREVVDAAQAEAARLGASDVGADHLLLGLLAVSLARGTIAGDILQKQMGIRLEALRDALLAQVPPVGESTAPHGLLAPDAERVLNRDTYAEARELHDTFIGTEHQLLGLLRDGSSRAAQILLQHGASLERTRQAVRELRAEEAAGGAAS
jgi:DNA-directed RNA polymerase specialized sigma24 family protein